MECLDTVQKCHSCSDLNPGFECVCNEGFHIWKGDNMEIIKSRDGENGQKIWHILAENVSCVSEYTSHNIQTSTTHLLPFCRVDCSVLPVVNTSLRISMFSCFFVSTPGNTCDALPEQLDNGIQITVNNTYFYKDIVMYQCNVGYQIDGSDDKLQQLQCQASGIWKNNLDGGSTVLPCSST